LNSSQAVLNTKSNIKTYKIGRARKIADSVTISTRNIEYNSRAAFKDAKDTNDTSNSEGKIIKY